jgi:predicted  nucleic acid-binding Zn-ribbon protein
MYKVGWKEAELRTKLLKHTAGVLALSARKKEEEEQGLNLTTPLSPTLNQLGSSTNRSRDTPSPNGPSADHRFDGAHFFSGNREAVMPLPRNANSPFTSPAISQGGFPSNNLQQHQDQIHELESQMSRLETEKSRAVQELTQVRNEIEGIRRGESNAKERAATLEKDVASLRQGLERAEEDVSRARKEADGVRQEMSLARSTSTDHQRHVDSAKDEAREAGNKAKELELELAELEMKLAEAEQKTHELESEIEEVKLEKDSNEKEWATRLEEVVTRNRAVPEEGEETLGEQEARRKARDLEEDQRKMVQAIGDVLRRHRTRPILGSVLRETPSFDDTTQRQDLTSYLASTLDAHFEKVSTHVTHLNEELSTVRNDLDETRMALEAELNQAQDRQNALENEVESIKMEKDLLQQSLDSAKSQSSGFENRLASIPILEQNLSTAITNETKTREEFSASQAKIASLESQLAETTGQHSKSTKVLTDLFKSLPPLDTRPLPEHGSNDLASLKNAFDPNARRQLGNFIAGITSSEGKFSIEGLAERIKLLMAEDQKVVQRLSAFETEKATFEKTRKAVEEKSADLQSNERKVSLAFPMNRR